MCSFLCQLCRLNRSLTNVIILLWQETVFWQQFCQLDRSSHSHAYSSFQLYFLTAALHPLTSAGQIDNASGWNHFTISVWDTEYPSVFVNHLSYTTPNMQPLLFCSVQFKMASMHSEKPICAPSHCVWGLCCPTFPSHLFCFFHYVSSLAHGPHCACKILCFYLDPLHACLCVPVGHLGGGGGALCQRKGSGRPFGVHQPGATLHTARTFVTAYPNRHSAPKHVGPP